jgi:hypothetical protein
MGTDAFFARVFGLGNAWSVSMTVGGVLLLYDSRNTHQKKTVLLS